jgi:hypothetical protein
VTLLPSKEFGVRGHEGKAYEVNAICAVPHCSRTSAHAHHIWPRSHLRSQPYEWVELPDGTIIGNRTGLCFGHHEQVTGEIGGYRARIVFSSGVFWWAVKPEEGRPRIEQWPHLGLLDPQPPGAGSTNIIPPVEEDGVCPTCQRPRRKATVAGPKRKTKTWTLTVPDDAEIGSDVLDEYADDIAILLGFHEESSRLRRYHAVATALAWVIQNREAFARDLQEAARA